MVVAHPSAKFARKICARMSLAMLLCLGCDHMNAAVPQVAGEQDFDPPLAVATFGGTGRGMMATRASERARDEGHCGIGI